MKYDVNFYGSCTDTFATLIIAMHAVAKAMHVLYIRDRAHAGPLDTEPDILTIKCWLNGTEAVPEQLGEEEDGSDTVAFEAEKPPDVALARALGVVTACITQMAGKARATNTDDKAALRCAAIGAANLQFQKFLVDSIKPVAYLLPLLTSNKSRCILPRCAENDEASGLLYPEQAQGEQFLLLSSFELYNKIFSSAGGQMQVVLKKMAGLLTPPRLEDSIRLHINNQKAAMDAILNTPGLTTKEDLARPVKALSAVAFVHQAANHQPLGAETRSVYQRIEEKLVMLIKDLPTALTLLIDVAFIT